MNTLVKESGPCSCGFWGCHDASCSRNRALAVQRAAKEDIRTGRNSVLLGSEITTAMATARAQQKARGYKCAAVYHMHDRTDVRPIAPYCTGVRLMARQVMGRTLLIRKVRAFLLATGFGALVGCSGQVDTDAEDPATYTVEQASFIHSTTAQGTAYAQCAEGDRLVEGWCKVRGFKAYVATEGPDTEDPALAEGYVCGGYAPNHGTLIAVAVCKEAGDL